MSGRSSASRDFKQLIQGVPESFALKKVSKKTRIPSQDMKVALNTIHVHYANSKIRKPYEECISTLYLAKITSLATFLFSHSKLY